MTSSFVQFLFLFTGQTIVFKIDLAEDRAEDIKKDLNNGDEESKKQEKK